MSNEQMAQSILQFTGGKGNIRMVSNCMTRVRLEVNDPSVVQIDQIKALKGVFGVHVDAQVQVIVGPGTAAKVAACLQELLGDAHKAAGQADKEAAQEIAARNKQVIKGRQKVSKGKLFLKTIFRFLFPAQRFTMWSPWPSSQVRRLRVVMSISRCRASLVVQAMCGVRMALGRLRRRLSCGSGSVPKASAP